MRFEMNSSLSNSTRADRLVSPFLIPSSPQRFTHRGAGVCFCYRVKVAVDIRRGAHIAMSEPFLDLPYRHALGKQ